MEEWLKKIQDSSSKLLVPLKSENTYKLVINEAIKLLSGVHGSVILYQKDELVRVYSTTPLLEKIKIKQKNYIQEVYSTGKLIVRDVKYITDPHQILKTLKIKNIVFIPLCFKSQPIGVLTVHTKNVTNLTQVAIQSIELFGNIASLAIRNSDLYEQGLERLKEKEQLMVSEDILEKIYKASMKFLVPMTTEETYSMIVEEAIKLVKAEYGSILLGREDGLERVYASSALFYKITPRKKGIMYGVYKNRKARVLQSQDIIKIHPQFKETETRSDILIPLAYRNKSIGVLSVLSKRNVTFSEKELDILKLFGSLASLAIRKTELYDEAKKALQTRDLFIAMAAHEFRTPLTTIHGYSELLKLKFGLNDSPYTKWVDSLNWEVLRLTRLINEFLELNRIRNGNLYMNLKECNLKEIIERTTNDYRFIDGRRQIIFLMQPNIKNPTVIADYDKLYQVITNLLDNASKYSPENEDIIVNLKSSSTHFIISVKDKGKGIPKAEIPKIFDEFYRFHETPDRGMGLGLYLAKKIVDGHHGIIDVHSKLNKGTEMEIKLPKLRQSV